MRRIIAVFVLACAVPAVARPRVTVDPSIPLSLDDLDDAIDIRIGTADPVVHLFRDSTGRIVVVVDDRTQVVATMPDDPRAAARVVAMIIAALADPNAPPPVIAPPAAAPVAVASPAVAAAEPAAPSKLGMRIVPELIRDDSGYLTTEITGSLVYRFSPNAYLIATAGLGTASMADVHDRVVPLRLGLEGRSGVIGLELGALAIAHTSTCSEGSRGATSAGVYGAVHMYFPITERVRAVVDAGGHYILAGPRIDFSPCYGPTDYQEYAGRVGAGAEWSF